MTNGEHIREEELQLLALGALPEEEAAAALQHAADCAKCGALLAEERGRAALLVVCGDARRRPAATVKAELLARIRAEREAEETYRWPSKPERTGYAPAASGPKRAWWQWVMAPVAAALLLAALVEWRENRRLAGELANANHEIVQMTNERQRAEMLVDLLSAPDTTSVKLAAAPETERSTGMVRYNPRKGMVVYIRGIAGAARGQDLPDVAGAEGGRANQRGNFCTGAAWDAAIVDRGSVDEYGSEGVCSDD